MKIIIGLFTFLIAAQVLAASCNVVSVADGDTLTVDCAGKPREKVRLTEINAPEKGRPYSKRSRESLNEMCFGKPATLDRKGRDRYGRTLARVYCNGIDTSAEQVRRGMARVYHRCVKESPLCQLQDEAKKARRGLWAAGRRRR